MVLEGEKCARKVSDAAEVHAQYLLHSNILPIHNFGASHK